MCHRSRIRAFGCAVALIALAGRFGGARAGGVSGGNMRADRPVLWCGSSSEGATMVNRTMRVLAVGAAILTAACGGTDANSVAGPPPSDTGAVNFQAIAAGIRPRGFGQGSYSLVAPAFGGTNYHVAPTGTDTNPGTAAAPFRTINRAAGVATAGDVVTIEPGTYAEDVVVMNSGTKAKPIVFQAAQRGSVVLTGGQYSVRPASWTGNELETGQLYVTLRGLIFRAYAANVVAPGGPNFPAAVKAARGWRVEDCFFDAPGNTGVQVRGADVSIVKSTIQNSYVLAIGVWSNSEAERVDGPGYTPIDGLRLTDLVLRGNHGTGAETNGEYSIKLMTTRGAVVDNIESYGNMGPGLWFDSQNSNYVVRNSYFHDNVNNDPNDNTGAGLFLEISWEPGLVERNVFVNNQGPGVNVANSAGVTIRKNLFSGNAICVQMVNVDRGKTSSGAPMFPLKDITVVDNQCKEWDGFSGVHVIGRLPAPNALGIRVDSNLYDPGAVRRLSWYDGIGAGATLADMRRKFGWEANGAVGTISWP